MSPEGFESGWNEWHAEGGLWQIGAPTVGPSQCKVGSSCAGTLLDANYFSDTDSRLISPTIALPTLVNSDEEIWLEFWHWFDYGLCDSGVVQYQERNPDGTWSAWANASYPAQNQSDWSREGVNLTPYAGKTIRLAFFHQAQGG